MISKGECHLYHKCEDYNVVRVVMYKSGKIKTYWQIKSKKKYPEYIKKVYMINKNILHKLKLNGCAICGYNECDACLDFHHVNPKDKKFLITTSHIARKNKFVVEELSKCILLCKNCHYEIHDKERRC